MSLSYVAKAKNPLTNKQKYQKKSDLVNYGIYISSIYLKEVSLRSRLCKSHESLQSLQSLQSHAPVFFFFLFKPLWLRLSGRVCMGSNPGSDTHYDFVDTSISSFKNETFQKSSHEQFYEN